MSEGISIGVVLARMEITHDAGGPVSFDIEFIKDDGTIRIMTAQNHVKHGKNGGGTGEKSKFKYHLKENGTVLLYDVDLGKPRTVRIDRIMRFNREKVIH